MTTLTITPNLSKKTARFVGAVAAGEHVEVTLKFGALITNTSSLRMRVVWPCGTLAIFPQPESEDAWEVSGEDLKCVLNLNTIQMLKALAPAIEAELLVVLDDAENHVLYFKDTCAFKHWPMRRGDETPYDLDEFPGLIEEWREEIDNIAASVEKDGKVATISITDKDGNTTTAQVRDGEDGQNGRDGTDGVGVPGGGTTGQMLVKASDDDYDLKWVTGGAGGAQPNWAETNPASPAFIKNKPTAFPPSAHASTHAAGGSDPITPASIGALAENGTANEALKLAALQGSVTLEYNPTTGRFRQDGMGGVQIGDLANMSDIPALAAPSSTATSAQAAQAKAVFDALAAKVDSESGKTLIASALVAWLTAFKGADTATTLQSLLTALAGKATIASPSFTGTVGIAGVGGSQGASLTAQGGRLINNGDTLANADDIPYAAAESPSAMDASDRVVTRYKVAAGTPLTITLPEISAENKFVVNLDLEIDAIGVTTLPAITIQPATGGKAYAVKGTMPEIKPDCITMIDATSIPGMNAWTIIGASELKEVANA